MKCSCFFIFLYDIVGGRKQTKKLFAHLTEFNFVAGWGYFSMEI